MSSIPHRPQKLVIVGGVAGGATAAARARRIAETAEIVVLERGEFISFANCGLPYHVGGEIPHRASLVLQTPAGLGQRFRLDIRTRHEVLAIDRTTRRVRVRDLAAGREYDESYDVLLLSPGAAPLRPALPGGDHPRIGALRNIPDVDRIRALVDAGAKTALVVGGGFIGLEMAENLRRRGLAVTIVERLPQVMPPLDADMAAPLHAELLKQGIDLRLNAGVAAFADDQGRVRATLTDGTACVADVVVLSVGVRPDSALAKAAGLECDERGAIRVDEHLRTSDPHIYAVGDAVTVRDFVLDRPAYVPLAGPANRQARLAVDHMFGRAARFRGVQGTSIVRVFDTQVATTGPSERTLKAAGHPYRKIYAIAGHHVGYFPGAQRFVIKLLFTPDDGRVLGAQIVGGAGVDKRIDVLSVAVQARLTVYDLEELELAYAPQFGAAKDPVNMAGFIAANVLRGDNEMLYAEDLPPDAHADWTVLDVRSPAEYETDHIPGSVLIPLPELRDRLAELPRTKRLAVYCAIGQRSYYACRILRQLGMPALNLAGGLTVYRWIHPTASGQPAQATG